MDYSKLKVAELKRLCDEQGIEYQGGVKKAELVRLLESYGEPVEVEAEPIDDEMMPVKPFAIDMTAIQSEIDVLTDAIEKALTVWGELLVDQEVIEDMSGGDLLVCESQLADAIKEANEARLQLGRDYCKPLDAANARYKELMGPVEELHERFSERRQSLRYMGLEATYLECCAANGLDALPQVVPFDALSKMHPQWMRRDANSGKAAEKVEQEVFRIGKAWANLRSQKAAMRFYDEAEAEFFRTLDVERAIEANNRREAEQQRIDALRAKREANELARKEAEARRQAQQSAQAAAETLAAQQPQPEPQPVQQSAELEGWPVPRRYLLDVTMPPFVKDSLKTWFQNNGAHGNVAEIVPGSPNVIKLVKSGALASLGVAEIQKEAVNG